MWLIKKLAMSVAQEVAEFVAAVLRLAAYKDCHPSVDGISNLIRTNLLIAIIKNFQHHRGCQRNTHDGDIANTATNHNPI